MLTLGCGAVSADEVPTVGAAAFAGSLAALVDAAGWAVVPVSCPAGAVAVGEFGDVALGCAVTLPAPSGCAALPGAAELRSEKSIL